MSGSEPVCCAQGHSGLCAWLSARTCRPAECTMFYFLLVACCCSGRWAPRPSLGAELLRPALPSPQHCLSRPFLQGHALLRGHPGPGCWQYLHSPEQIPTQVSRPRGRGLGGAGLRVPSVISLFSHPGMPWTSVTSTQSHLGVPSPPLSLGTSSACLRTH